MENLLEILLVHFLIFSPGAIYLFFVERNTYRRTVFANEHGFTSIIHDSNKFMYKQQQNINNQVLSFLVVKNNSNVSRNMILFLSIFQSLFFRTIRERPYLA